jgi:CBS domain-containing protein/sporulation protein YlmC with PRC-barrel domain
LISRPFGYPPLMIPWDQIGKIDKDSVVLNVEAVEAFEGKPQQGELCLSDHLLNKKVLDCDDDEIEVVYDIKLALRGGKLYVTDVDCSRAAFLRRIGLGGVANFVQGIAARIKDETIPWTYVQQLPEDIGSFRGAVKLNVLKAKLPDIHPADLADILEELNHDKRLAIFSELETEHASDTLEEIEPRVQRELIAALTKERAAELIKDMTPAQAADVLAVLPATDVNAILELMDGEDVGKIRRILEHHEDKIADFATSRFISFPEQTSVQDVLGEYRFVAATADVWVYIYVVDARRKLLGVLDLQDVLKADPGDSLADLMTINFVTLHVDDTVKDAAKLFDRYGFQAIPIVDADNLMIGVITFRDVMDLKDRSI